VRHQTRQPDLWIISLGKGETLGDFELPPYAHVHRWGDDVGQPMHGQIDSNSKYQIEVMRQVPEGYAASYFDDDDWYGPNYLQKVEQALEKNDIVGVSYERRFCLGTRRWMAIKKSGCNAGACSFRYPAIAKWIEWLQDPSTKWSWLRDRFKVDIDIDADRVAMKNGPGEGHLFPPADRKWQPYSSNVIKQWLGSDISSYLDFMPQ
jgi:hypothetical protein